MPLHPLTQLTPGCTHAHIIHPHHPHTHTHAQIFHQSNQDADHAVNERVVHKLGIRPPSAALVQKYLLEIAKTAGVEWTPTEKVGWWGGLD